MKLTITDNRERIKRYGHVKPAPRGSVRCLAKCPGTLHTCTLKRGHAGPHVAHGRFKKVVAVWEGRIDVPKLQKRAGRTAGARTRKGLRGGGLVPALKAFWGRLARRTPSLEEVFLLVLALSMAGFAIDWALRILQVY